MISVTIEKVLGGKQGVRMFMVTGRQDSTSRRAQHAVWSNWKITSHSCSLQHCDGSRNIGAWIGKLSS